MRPCERQRRLIRSYAAEHGLSLPDELLYRDNGLSAWTPGNRRDRDWDRMLADGKAGRFGGLLVWKLDRFARNIRDGEDLIDLGVLIDGPDTGRLDLRTSHGKSVFRKQIEAATHSSNETSDKVRAAFADMVASGYRVGGSGPPVRLRDPQPRPTLDDGYDDDDERRRRGRAHRPGRRGARGRGRDHPRAGRAAAPGGHGAGDG